MILITGANGLLGSFLTNHLLQSGKSIVGLVRENSDLSLLAKNHPNLSLYKGDLLDIPSLFSLFDNYKITQVIHAGAVVSFQKKDRVLMEKVNVEGSRNLVNICIKYNTEKFIHISSVAALGRSMKGTMDETSEWKNSPYNTVYGITKHAAELEVWRGQIEGLKTVILNPSLILSAADGRRSSSRFFSYLASEPKFFPTGNLNYVDIRDVAVITEKLLDMDIQNERFIVNAGTVSYKDFFRLAAQRGGLKAPSIPVKKYLGKLALVGETLRSKLLNREPLLTSETLRSSRSKVAFDNKKISKLLDYKFLPLEATIDWAWENYKSPEGIEK